MDDNDALAARFEASGPRMRAMAYRMLGSATDAEDAVQEAWIHVAGSGVDGVANIEGWFTTITARVCLDMLRARRSRPEEPAGEGTDFPVAPVSPAGAAGTAGPEQEAVLADSVGLALLVILGTLAPAERVAFVLHDMFAVPFGEIASITGRSADAARQLASRARRRIRGGDPASGVSLARQRAVAEAFLAASRDGDIAGLLAILDPDVVLRADATAVPSGKAGTLRGAAAVANGARAAAPRSRFSDVAMVNGAPGIVFAPHGRLAVALAFTFSGDKISAIDVIADPPRLADVGLAIFDG
jgi:RNA polymerase sigma factor (sigma-70 family)